MWSIMFWARGSLKIQAAAAMVSGNFRHLVVIDGTEVAGLLSMRDIVRCWSGVGAPPLSRGQGVPAR